MWITFLTAGQAWAQACTCARNVALPTGEATRSGEVTVALDYLASLTGDPDAWRGFAVVDPNGDSMAGMYMPPDLAQTWSLAGTVGLPADFSANLTVPFLWINHLGESEMAGDVDMAFLGDVTASARWGRMFGPNSFLGASIGVSAPTGKVVPSVPTRTGKGAVAAMVSAQFAQKLSPHLALAAAVNTTPTPFAGSDGYQVGTWASTSAGLRWNIDQDARWSVSGFGVLSAQAHDRKDELVYRHTGYTSVDAALAGRSVVWRQGARSIALDLRGEIPLYQVVGDPMYAANLSAGLGISMVTR